jgi:hypothetical protein
MSFFKKALELSIAPALGGTAGIKKTGNWLGMGKDEGGASAEELALQEQLKQQAAGNYVSPAQLQMQQGQQAILEQNAALQQSNRGVNPALGQRNVMMANVDANNQAVQQTSLLRAIEQQKIRDQQIAMATGLQDRKQGAKQATYGRRAGFISGLAQAGAKAAV